MTDQIELVQVEEDHRQGNSSLGRCEGGLEKHHRMSPIGDAREAIGQGHALCGPTLQVEQLGEPSDPQAGGDVDHDDPAQEAPVAYADPGHEEGHLGEHEGSHSHGQGQRSA